MKIIIVVYLILIWLNVLYITSYNAINEAHPKDENDVEEIKYKNALNPFFIISCLRNL